MPTECDSDGESKKSALIKKWECSKQCKPPNQFEVDAILTFKGAFHLSMAEVDKPQLSATWVAPMVTALN